MKTIGNIFKTGLFLVLLWVFVNIVFGSFKYLVSWTLQGLGYLQTNLHWAIFWPLFICFGLGIVYSVYGVFKIVVGYILFFLVKLCPYQKVGTISTAIIAFYCGGWFVYELWADNGWPNFTIGITSLVISGMIISLSETMHQITKAHYNKELSNMF